MKDVVKTLERFLPVPGDILVFMSGQEEIEMTCELIEGLFRWTDRRHSDRSVENVWPSWKKQSRWVFCSSIPNGSVICKRRSFERPMMEGANVSSLRTSSKPRCPVRFFPWSLSLVALTGVRCSRWYHVRDRRCLLSIESVQSENWYGCPADLSDQSSQCQSADESSQSNGTWVSFASSRSGGNSSSPSLSLCSGNVFAFTPRETFGKKCWKPMCQTFDARTRPTSFCCSTQIARRPRSASLPFHGFDAPSKVDRVDRSTSPSLIPRITRACWCSWVDKWWNFRWIQPCRKRWSHRWRWVTAVKSWSVPRALRSNEDEANVCLDHRFDVTRGINRLSIKGQDFC